MASATTVVLVAPTPELDDLVAALRREELSVDGSTGDLLVVEPRGGGPAAVLDIEERDLHDYVAGLAATYGRDLEDPRSSARGLAAVHVVDHLTTDHGGGVNRVRRLVLERGDGGLQLVEERTDDPPPAPATGCAPHDDPAVFAADLEALAVFLRSQGLDAVADPDEATLRLSGRYAPEPVTVALGPDLYRRWFEATQEEFEAIDGDPREHAWRLWCRTVATLPTRSPGTRVALVESTGGEVLLRPEGPTEPQYIWSADPGS